MFADMYEGLLMILQWETALALAVGVFIGIVFGALPGLTTGMAMSIFVPVTFFMDPLVGIPFLLGLYKGGIYGGSITAILIATPGTNAAVATVFDGYELAKKGMAGKALKMALYASVIGEVWGELILLFFVGILARAALLFGAAETFAIMLFSYTVIAGLSGESLIKGIIAAAFGLFISTIGIDPVLGVTRFTFGSMNLTSGLTFVSMLIGTFAVSEVLNQIERRSRGASAPAALPIEKGDGNRVTLKDFKECAPAMAIGAMVGTWIGLLPGIGQPVAAFLGYGFAKKVSKHPERFGSGSLEGVAGPETANNAVNGTAMVPLLSLGIPGDTISAILLGALVAQGLSPGPLLFQQNGPLIYAILLAMLIGNVTFFALAYLVLPFMAKVAYVPKNILLPGILTMAFVGGYAINGNIFDIIVMGTFGIVGYFFKKGNFPLPPFVIAVLLGAKTEGALSRSLLLSKGSLAIFYEKKIAFFFICLTALTVLGIAVHFIWSWYKQRKNTQNLSNA